MRWRSTRERPSNAAETTSTSKWLSPSGRAPGVAGVAVTFVDDG